MAAKALEWTKNHKVINHVCSDEEAVLACERFAGKFNVLRGSINFDINSFELHCTS